MTKDEIIQMILRHYSEVYQKCLAAYVRGASRGIDAYYLAEHEGDLLKAAAARSDEIAIASCKMFKQYLINLCREVQ